MSWVSAFVWETTIGGTRFPTMSWLFHSFCILKDKPPTTAVSHHHDLDLSLLIEIASPLDRLNTDGFSMCRYASGRSCRVCGIDVCWGDWFWQNKPSNYYHRAALSQSKHTQGGSPLTIPLHLAHYLWYSLSLVMRHNADMSDQQSVNWAWRSLRFQADETVE